MKKMLEILFLIVCFVAVAIAIDTISYRKAGCNTDAVCHYKITLGKYVIREVTRLPVLGEKRCFMGKCNSFQAVRHLDKWIGSPQ